MSAIVVKVLSVEKHPNADKLEILTVADCDCAREPTDDCTHDRMELRIVTGPHYREGMRGVFIPAGSFIPGYMVEEFWLGGRGAAMKWFQIIEKTMRGIKSPGIFAGETWRVNAESEWQTWPYFRQWWKTGEDVSAYLGVRSDVPVGSTSTYASKR